MQAFWQPPYCQATRYSYLGMIMKKIDLLICAFATLLFFSCEKEAPYTRDPFQTISREVTCDFNNRYPDVTVTDAYQWNDVKNIVTDIVFIDKEGLTNKAMYNNGKWSITEKMYDVNDFIYGMPRKILKAYLGTGIEDEEYLSDNDYVIEFSRNGLDNKQYEFHCSAPYSDGKEAYEHLIYDIVIADDGTLLTCSHSSFNRSVWWYDMSSSIDLVRAMYKNASLLGAVNDAGNNKLFIRDNDIIKTITLRDFGNGFEWMETSYPLDINTTLPAHVIIEQQAYEAEHPDDTFYALSHCDTKEGSFYGLTYGSELNNRTFFVRAE